MTTIPPSTPLPPVPTAAGPGPTAVLTQLPPDLQSAGRGSLITGTVMAVDSQGQVLLQTAAGVVGFQSVVSLSVGQQVTLQVQSTGAQAQAVVLSAEAKVMSEIASAGLAAQAPTATAPSVAAPPTPASTIAPSVTAGPLVVATVIASPTTSTPASPAGPAPAAAQQSATPSAAASAPIGAAAAPTPASTAPLTTSPAASPASPSAPAASAGRSASIALAGSAAAAATAASAPPPPPAALPASSLSSPPAPAGSAPVSAGAGPPPAVAPQAAPSSDPAATSPSPGPATGAPTPSAAGTTPAVPPPSTLVAQTAPRAVSVAIASYAASSAASVNSPAPAASPAPLPASLPAPPGTQVPLRFIGALPDLAAAAASASSGQVVATVVARTPAGQMIVDTAIGRLAFAVPATETVTIGSQIAFEIAAPAIRPATAAPMGNPGLVAGRGLAALTTEWPALKTAISTLATVDPALARQVTEAALPQLDSPRFVGQVLTFLATAAADVKALLGQAAVDALLQAGHGDVLARLETDLRQMGQLNASATNWQVFYVPLLDSTEVRQLRVFTRRRKDAAGRARDSGRFVVEAEFEHLGPLQLDGLVQKPRLDLILRSHAELTSALRTGITDVFNSTCEAAGLNGKIFFQAIPSFPISPFDEMATSPAPGLSI